MAKNWPQRIGFSIFGLLWGTLGSYLASIGIIFAFPETSPGHRDYDELVSLVPLGYIIMFVCLIVMGTVLILLRKNKANLLSFLIAWLVGLGIFGVWVFVLI